MTVRNRQDRIGNIQATLAKLRAGPGADPAKRQARMAALQARLARLQAGRPAPAAAATLSPGEQASLIFQARQQAELDAQFAAHEQNLRGLLGGFANPDAYAALGIQGSPSLGELSNSAIAALLQLGYRGQAAGQKAGTTADSNEMLAQAVAAAAAAGQPFYGSTVPSTGAEAGAVDPTAVSQVPGWWTPEMAAAAVAARPGPQFMVDDSMRPYYNQYLRQARRPGRAKPARRPAGQRTYLPTGETVTPAAPGTFGGV